MQISPFNMNLRRTILVTFVFSFSVFFMVMAMRQMEWHQVLEVMSNAQLYPWLLFSTLCYLTGHLVRGVRTRLLVSHDTKLSVLTASNIVVVGYAVNNILPVRIGELARAGMLSERTGITFSQSLTIVFLERLLDGIAIVLMLILSALSLSAWEPVRETIFFSSLTFGIASVFVLSVIIAPNRFMAVTSKVIYVISPRWHDATLRFVMGIVNGVNYLRNPSNLLKVLLISILVWLCDMGLFFLLMPAFGIELNILHAMFVMAGTNLGLLMPSGPGHIVLFRSFCIQGMTLLGITHTTALGFAIVDHLAIYISLTLWGGAVILWYGITLGLTINLTKKAKSIYGLPEQVPVTANLLGATSSDKLSETPSTFILKLTEAALPLETLCLADQQAVVSYVANFIQGEIKSLSKRFQILFKIGMLGFGVLVWLRYFRSFSFLPLAKRVEIFNAWAYGKIPIKRQLFKLIRSTALLAFFEYPVVVDVLENQRNTR
jgi:hypothetical protein